MALGASERQGQKIIIEEDITEICYLAFPNYTNLTSVQLPESLEVIGQNAFSGTGLTEIRIPDNVRYLGSGAFAKTPLYQKNGQDLFIDGWLISFHDDDRTEYRVPPGTRGIAESAFGWNCCVEKLYIPGSVKAIGRNTYSKRFKYVYLGRGCPAVSGYTFGQDQWHKDPQVIRCANVIPWEESEPAWSYDKFHHTENIYHRAKSHPRSERMREVLQFLKDGAMDEAVAHCSKHTSHGRAVTPAEYRKFHPFTIEVDLYNFGRWGLKSIVTDLSVRTVTIIFNPQGGMMCCTALTILNQLEKEDHKAKKDNSFTVNCHIPADLMSENGFLALKEILLNLFSWVKDVQVIPRNEVSKYYSWYNSSVLESQKYRISFTQEPAKSSQAVHERFYAEMRNKPAFRNAFACAITEINQGILKQKFRLRNASGDPLTVSQLQTYSETEQLEYMLLLGNRSLIPGAMLRLSADQNIPCCVAITLLYMAYTGQQASQLVDTGDSADHSMLRHMVEMLKPCLDNWHCKIY